ncbi:BRO family protein [Kitasatospora sp. NPDC057692]|uniref:BRO family protein n=1 Tax=Kitasatospora sp. NPDC057692 TaxID=3346215 RepID=UPI00369FF262
MDDEQTMVLVRSSFPVTGQPIRVVMIDGEPWFVTADVCRILGRGNPSDAHKVVKPENTRIVDLRSVTISETDSNHVSAGQKPYAGTAASFFRSRRIIRVPAASGTYCQQNAQRKALAA